MLPVSECVVYWYDVDIVETTELGLSGLSHIDPDFLGVTDGLRLLEFIGTGWEGGKIAVVPGKTPPVTASEVSSFNGGVFFWVAIVLTAGCEEDGEAEGLFGIDDGLFGCGWGDDVMLLIPFESLAVNESLLDRFVSALFAALPVWKK